LFSRSPSSLDPARAGQSWSGTIRELSQLGGSVEDVLAVLDAASEAADCVGLFTHQRYSRDRVQTSRRTDRRRDRRSQQ